MVSVLTVIVLPAVWLANERGETATPNVAAVGLAAGGAVATTAPESADAPAPAYLSSTPPRREASPSDVAVGTSADTLLASAMASFRRAVGHRDTCWYNGVPGGELITVSNPANGRAVECWTVLRPEDQPDLVVLAPEAYAELADFTDAPIHVEIRQ